MDKNVTLDLTQNFDMGDWRKDRHRDYVFQTNGDGCQWYNKSIALIAYFNSRNLINKCLEYIIKLPNYIDIFIVAASEEIASLIKQKLEMRSEHTIAVVVSENKDGEMSTLLVAYKDILKEYEYLGYVYDRKKDQDVTFQTVEYSLCDLLWENAVKNAAYVGQVIDTFEREPLLGVLASPPPYLSTFFKTDLSVDKPPFIFANSFWCRTRAFEPLLDSNVSKKEIERLIQYAAQSQGYYCGIMMTAEYASLYVSNYQFMMNELADKGIFTDEYWQLI